MPKKCLDAGHSAYDILFFLFNHTKINIKHLSLEFYTRVNFRSNDSFLSHFLVIFWVINYSYVQRRILSWTLFLLAGFFPPLIWNLKEKKLKPTYQKARSFNPKRKSDGISVLKCYLAHLLRCIFTVSKHVAKMKLLYSKYSKQHTINIEILVLNISALIKLIWFCFKRYKNGSFGPKIFFQAHLTQSNAWIETDSICDRTVIQAFEEYWVLFF